MKKHPNLLRSVVVLAGVFALGLQGIQAETIKYSELEKKISIDRTPVKSPGAAPTSYAPALENVMPAVVTIFANKSISLTSARNPMQEELFRRMFPDVPEDFFDKEAPERKQEGLGSGVIISDDGYILTNNHVVGDADEITVALSTNNREYEATLVGADPRTDVALIKIQAKGLKAITIGDSSKIRIGDVALAVGNPLGLEQTATLGIVSGLGRNELGITNGGYENFIQTDAAINRGNSGGALVDANGRLIGINTAIQSGFSGGNIGIGFAIPSNMALNIVQRLLDDGGVVKRGFLGIVPDDLDENFAKALGRKNQDGVLVRSVEPGTSADKAGLKVGDLILSLNGEPAGTAAEFRLNVSNYSPGSSIALEVVSNGKTKNIDVKLGDLSQFVAAAGGNPGRGGSPAKPKELFDGVRIKEIDDESREALGLDEKINGVLVESVKDNVLAAEAGLRPGMVILQIDQQPVTTVRKAHEIIADFEGDVLLLQVNAAGRTDILAVPLTE
ncbi:MAG: Do family serine endopeptidase [Verrucomicrobiales bacterium]|nr:Do family serine endopeptidase [Verrucomicrobiales bacterium]